MKNSEVTYTFKDGTVINGKDAQRAEIEIDAFYLFSGVPHLGILNRRPQPDICLEKVYSPIAETSEDLLNATAGDLVNKSKSSLSVKLLNGRERVALKSKTVKKADVARAQSFRRIKEVFKSIAGRERGWTLLGVKSKVELNALLTKCYGADFAKEVLARALFPRQLALALLAYQNKMAATVASGEKAVAKSGRRKSLNTV